MTMLGTHVPVSWWTLLVLLCGVMLGHPVSHWLAASLGWRHRASVVAWVAFSAVLALTIPPVWAEPADPDHCLPDYPAQVWIEPLHTSGGVGGGLLNVLLLLPLGAALVLAAGRARIAVVVVLTLPAIVEAAQRSIPGRLCSFSDYLANATGGVLGVVIGMLIISWRVPSRECCGKRPHCVRCGVTV
ncbi:VanZ family protein [Kibdelosporangium persicum]|uniref:VanZ family protein n=1 Tax=Kibdelosporangium persicum TaxID=2698649 RepID=UPI001565A2A2|nr:VanZ family protein [Kibdelosporangium persicum]